MLKSKAATIVGSVIGILALVYGTAILFRLLFGAYLFEGGFANLNYGLLALLCAIPFALIAVIGRNGSSANKAVIVSGLLFSVIFVLVHLVLVLSAEVMDAAAIKRTVAVFPVSALLLAGALYFAKGREKVD